MTRTPTTLALALAGLTLLSACAAGPSESDLGPITNECGWNNPATAAPNIPCPPGG